MNISEATIKKMVNSSINAGGTLEVRSQNAKGFYDKSNVYKLMNLIENYDEIKSAYLDENNIVTINYQNLPIVLSIEGLVDEHNDDVPTPQDLEKLEFDSWILHNTLHEGATILVDRYPNIKQIETEYGELMPDVKYFEGEQALDDFYEEMNLDFNNVELSDVIWSDDESKITLKINGEDYNLEVF